MKSEKHPSKNMECKSTIRQNMMSVDDTNYLAKQSYHTKKDNIPVNSKQTDNNRGTFQTNPLNVRVCRLANWAYGSMVGGDTPNNRSKAPRVNQSGAFT